ncbi:hypothetical protein PABG_06702 [Paracoccidioides brasiliensis Pb03]|nr:hypothetical protein PABG_06702 [Paracoccidioides brasiliensis Pb03]
MPISTSSTRWRAIVNRDATANDFVYGVRTTKIYCRPRCPARLARRANVEFYDTPKQAEKAGYRPCKRCKPEDLCAPPDPHIKLALRACLTMTRAASGGSAMAQGAQAQGQAQGQRQGQVQGQAQGQAQGRRRMQRPTLQDLANEAGLTPSHFHRVFKKVVGITPGRFAREVMDGKKMGGYLKRLEEGISASGGGYAGYGGGAGAKGAKGVRGGDDGDGNGKGEGEGAAGRETASADVVAEGLVVDGISPAADSQTFTAPLSDAGGIRIDWNEFDRMLVGGAGAGAGAGGDAGRNNNNLSNSRHHLPGPLPHHNRGFSIANDTNTNTRLSPAQPQQQSSTYPPQSTTTTVTTTTTTPPDILTNRTLLDHYELPWDSPTCTLTFPTTPHHHTTNNATSVTPSGYSSGSLSPYDPYAPLLDTAAAANTDFYKFFAGNISNAPNTAPTTSAGKQQQQQQQQQLELELELELDLLPLTAAESETMTPVDTPPFIVDGLVVGVGGLGGGGGGGGALAGCFSGTSSSVPSTNASPLLFEEVDWYGSPSIFETYA